MRFVPAITLLASLGACQAGSRQPAGLYDDLGGHQRAVTTSDPLAQQWFDQGLTLLYAFSHDEAIRCFTEATKVDPGCAMAWWGIACANGPHINNSEVPPERDAAARAALERAHGKLAMCTPVERALIEAQAARWGPAPVEDRAELDEAYAEAMRDVWKRFPRDPDVGALCAEALMDLQPWDLWTRDGKPKGIALDAIETIERVLALQPANPLALHLHIHATEASPDPGRATASADRLAHLVPGAGHLLHMPAHTYLRTGRLADASEANVRAMAADARHRERYPRNGFIQLYIAHNAHFLAFASMMEGRYEAALQAAREMGARLPEEFVAEVLPFADGFIPVEYHVFVRFGRWEEILAGPEFPAPAIVANGVRRYARGVALNSLGRLDEAERELEALRELNESLDDRPIGNNPARTVMQIPEKILAGEVAFARGQRDQGLALLKEAVAIEDTLVYDEPPDWMMPVRHPYGAMLLEAQRWSEAEAAFRKDLEMFPKNGWSLFGLTRALRAQGREDEAKQAERDFKKSWARADVKIHAPCLCQPGSGPTVASTEPGTLVPDSLRR
jgi:tetratricopeptide (TPR) repeat protein